MHGKPEKIGLIGVGLLGSALAERLQAEGYAVAGYDLLPERRAALESLGGTAAATAEQVCRQTGRLFLSLPDSDAVESVVRSVLPCLAPGTLVIDTTTGDPDRTALLAAQLAERSVRYVDATVVGSSAQAMRREAIVLAGGAAPDIDAGQDVLATFARRVFHVGPSGSGARMKLVVNLVLGLNRAVLAEGLALAEAAGLEPAAALEALKAGPAYSAAMDSKGAKMLARSFAPEARLAQHLKDVRLILELGERARASLPLSRVHQELLERAVALGYAEADNSAIIEVFDSLRTGEADGRER